MVASVSLIVTCYEMFRCLRMKIVFDPRAIPVNTPASIGDTAGEKFNQQNLMVIKVGLYSIILLFFFWIYLVIPVNGLTLDIKEVVVNILIILPFLIIMPVIHELVHLISRPRQIFRHDTFLLIDYRKPIMQMSMSVRPGGVVTREGFIWMSLLPFIMLTLLPFTLVAIYPNPALIFFGILPCVNFSLSAVDIYQAFIIWRGTKYGEVLSRGNLS